MKHTTQQTTAHAPHWSTLARAMAAAVREAETESAETAASAVVEAETENDATAYVALLELRRLAHERCVAHRDITHTCADTLRYGMCLSDGRD